MKTPPETKFKANTKMHLLIVASVLLFVTSATSEVVGIGAHKLKDIAKQLAGTYKGNHEGPPSYSIDFKDGFLVFDHASANGPIEEFRFPEEVLAAGKSELSPYSEFLDDSETELYFFDPEELVLTRQLVEYYGSTMKQITIQSLEKIGNQLIFRTKRHTYKRTMSKLERFDDPTDSFLNSFSGQSYYTPWEIDLESKTAKESEIDSDLYFYHFSKTPLTKNELENISANLKDLRTTSKSYRTESPGRDSAKKNPSDPTQVKSGKVIDFASVRKRKCKNALDESKK